MSAAKLADAISHTDTYLRVRVLFLRLILKFGVDLRPHSGLGPTSVFLSAAAGVLRTLYWRCPPFPSTGMTQHTGTQTDPRERKAKIHKCESICNFTRRKSLSYLPYSVCLPLAFYDCFLKYHYCAMLQDSLSKDRYMKM